MATPQDTLIVCLSDMHSAGSTALFPNRFMQFKNVNHTPTREQVRMYAHWLTCADYVQTMRGQGRVFVVHNGDAVDGRHHNSTQIITYDPDEQREIHCELMDTFLRGCSFDRAGGDRLFYVNGTEVHGGDIEDAIGADLDAETTAAGLHAFKFLELEVNGRVLWFVHHGPAAGEGPDEGNGLRLWLRRVHWQRKKRNKPLPDLIISGHTHQAAYNTYIVSEGEGYHVLHGMITPSWQMKTRYAYMRVPIAVNEIGAAFVEVSAAGDIRLPVFLKLETENMETVTA